MVPACVVPSMGVMPMGQERNSCFVIMPFSETTPAHTKEYWTAHFERFLKPLIEQNSNLEARRSKPLRGDMLRQIIIDLVTSPMVVADLTDGNTNVYWELGVRQSFRHGTVTIAQHGTRLPFDLGVKGTLFYHDDRLLLEDFRQHFQEALADCLEHPDRPDSHVLESISGRGSLFQIFRRDETIRRLDALKLELQSNDFLINSLLKRIDKNQQQPSQRAFINARFVFSAMELLTTTRYVDEDEDFFQQALGIQGHLMSLNERLNFWRDSPDSTENWVLKMLTEVGVTDELQAFKDQVVAVRDKVLDQI